MNRILSTTLASLAFAALVLGLSTLHESLASRGSLFDHRLLDIKIPLPTDAPTSSPTSMPSDMPSNEPSPIPCFDGFSTCGRNCDAPCKWSGEGTEYCCEPQCADGNIGVPIVSFLCDVVCDEPCDKVDNGPQAPFGYFCCNA